MIGSWANTADKAIHYELLAKGYVALPVGWEPDISKGAGHKYVKRVPYTDNKGRKRYRYYYKVTSGFGVGNDFHMKEGAAFKYGKGHYHITAVDGDKVTIRHDESGKSATMTKDQLSDKLHLHHKDDIDAHKDKIAQKLRSTKGPARSHWIGQARRYGVPVPTTAVVNDQVVETKQKPDTSGPSKDNFETMPDVEGKPFKRTNKTPPSKWTKNDVERLALRRGKPGSKILKETTFVYPGGKLDVSVENDTDEVGVTAFTDVHGGVGWSPVKMVTFDLNDPSAVEKIQQAADAIKTKEAAKRAYDASQAEVKANRDKRKVEEAKDLLKRYHQMDADAVKKVQEMAQEALPGIRTQDAETVVSELAYGKTPGKLSDDFKARMVRENRVTADKKPKKKESEIDGGHHVKLESHHEATLKREENASAIYDRAVKIASLSQGVKDLGVSDAEEARIRNARKRIASMSGPLMRVAQSALNRGVNAIKEGKDAFEAARVKPESKTRFGRRTVTEQSAGRVNLAVREILSVVQKHADDHRQELSSNRFDPRQDTTPAGESALRAAKDNEMEVRAKRSEHIQKQIADQLGSDLSPSNKKAVDYLASHLARSGAEIHSRADIDNAIAEVMRMAPGRMVSAGEMPSVKLSDSKEQQARKKAETASKLAAAFDSVAKMAEKLSPGGAGAKAAAAKAEEQRTIERQNTEAADKAAASEAKREQKRAADERSRSEAREEAEALHDEVRHLAMAAGNKAERAMYRDLMKLTKPGKATGEMLKQAREQLSDLHGEGHESKEQHLPKPEAVTMDVPWPKSRTETTKQAKVKKYGSWGIAPAKGGGYQVISVDHGMHIGSNMNAADAEHMVAALHEANLGNLSKQEISNRISEVKAIMSEHGNSTRAHDHARGKANVERANKLRGTAQKARDLATKMPRSFSEGKPSVKNKAGATKRLKGFASTDAGRSMVHGFMVDGDKAVATDGHRLAIIPVKGIEQGRHSANKGDDTFGSFPDYKQVMPKEGNKHDADAAALSAMASAAVAHGKEGGGTTGARGLRHSIHLHPGPDGSLHATATYTDSEGDTHFISTHKLRGGAVSGMESPMTLNAKYLHDALQGSDGSIQVNLAKRSAEHSPLDIRREDGEQHIIMPIRTDKTIAELNKMAGLSKSLNRFSDLLKGA